MFNAPYLVINYPVFKIKTYKRPYMVYGRFANTYFVNLTKATFSDSFYSDADNKPQFIIKQ